MKNKFLFLFCISGFLWQFSFAQSTVSGSFMYQSILRTYRIYVPAIYNSSAAVPLVLNLHGYGSNNTQQEAYGDFRAIADTANFIIVHPNGTLDASNQRFWNCFGGPSPIDDVGFLSALIDTVSANYTIDQNCIYSTGMSNGGFMSYDLSYLLSNRIAAIASVTGSMVYSHLSACNPLHPTPAMQIHGTADAVVAYGGDAYFEPVDSLVKFWVEFNNCNPTPAVTNVPDINTTDGCTATHYVYSGGDSGATVEFYKIQGGGHSWPGAIFNVNTTNMDFSASVEIWRFFRQYKLNNLSNGINVQETEAILPVYPNPSDGLFTLVFTDFSKRTVTITDCLGQTVQTFDCLNDKASFYIELTGMYFVTISTEKGSTTQKVIRK
ncbi:MAG: T9SS type A sorting domain-containing protein [Bacteroidota bacterium]|nr:T9SS type A sorting domain-containing protein [Bacteroidota bacterium]